MADHTIQRSETHEFSLLLPPEGLFAQEEVELAIYVAEISGNVTGAPVQAARIRATIDMPSMPVMPKFEDVAHSHGIAGHYGVHPVFGHGGEYRLRLTLLPPDGQPASSVEFSLQVKDATRSRPAARPQPFSLELITSPAKPRAGEPVLLELAVRPVNTPGDKLVTEFDVAHEKLLHLILMRTDFSQFAHEHPEPAGNGKFRLSHTFATGGTYRVFVDVAPKGAGSQILKGNIAIGGDPGASWDLYEASTKDRGLKQKFEEMTLEWKLPGTTLPVGRTTVMTAQLSGSDGKPVPDLEPYLGAKGHLILIHQDTQTFVHSHPDDRTESPPGTIPFLARFPVPGLYRGWLQVRRNHQVKTASFIVQAE